MAWREELHPRDARGRFASKGSFSAVSIKATLANVHMASTEDLMDVFHRVLARKQFSQRDYDMLDKELARRENKTEIDAPDDTPEQKKIDDLVRRGWSYADAYADAYGVSERTTRGQEVDAMVGRGKGETREAAIRRSYAELVALQALQAEEATRGNLLTRPCAHVDPASLWSGPAARARKCASEELMRWWEENGGRRTYTEYKASLGAGGSRTKAAAEKIRLGSSGKDFG
jgi:hypothetical protein